VRGDLGDLHRHGLSIAVRDARRQTGPYEPIFPRALSTTPARAAAPAASPTCSPLGTLTNGQSVTVTIVVTANKPGLMVDHARVHADQRDPHPRNNDASTKTHVTK
jgi:hypothetical protein